MIVWAMDCVGHEQIALGVLEVDRIDLVGHGGRADLAFLDFLLEVFHRDVGPHVAAQVHQDIVDPLYGVEEGCRIVCRSALSEWWDMSV